mmetsp:Transcript_7957/g.23728  ORF Transcript_7957/g.23728 Transcript_7957/m.23728 type:complete len:205 (+) Transcript_7957:838-1452(+)
MRTPMSEKRPPRQPVHTAPAADTSASRTMKRLKARPPSSSSPSSSSMSASSASPVSVDTRVVATAASTAKTMASQKRCTSGLATLAMALSVDDQSVFLAGSSFFPGPAPARRGSRRSPGGRLRAASLRRSQRPSAQGPAYARTANAPQAPSKASVTSSQSARAPSARPMPLESAYTSCARQRCERRSSHLSTSSSDVARRATTP